MPLSKLLLLRSLTEQVNVLTIENNATDRTNLIRDVQKNQEDLQEIIDILAEFYEDMEDADDELWEDVEMINEDLGGMAAHMMEIIKLQSRIAVIEKPYSLLKMMGCNYGPINNSRWHQNRNGRRQNHSWFKQRNWQLL